MSDSKYFDFDPELADALEKDPELMRIAGMLSSAQHPEPPLDDAFKAALRRRLMDQAWDSVEDRRSWWRGWFAPQRLAWASAAAVLIVAASVVLYTSGQNTGGFTQTIVQVGSDLNDKQAVAPQQAIPLRFNVPMDHQSTQNAVSITPATAVTFSWNGDQVLYVTPTSGNLAPNTQYQVKVGPGAKAQNGSQTTQPQTVTFVTTDTAPSPSPSPTPTPTNLNGLLTNVHQLSTDYPPSGTVYPVVWSSDSSTVYFVAGGGALESVTVADGTKKTLVADGASLPAISQTTNRLAYVRGGKIEILDLTAGTTREVAVDAAPTALAWAHDRLYWGSSSGVFGLDDSGPARLADLPTPDATVALIAPDGRHAVATVGDGLSIVDLKTNKSATVCAAACASALQGWSPDGSRLVVDGNIYNTSGKAVSSIPPGDMSWSTAQEILLGSDTALFEVRTDGSEYTKLADGTYRLPVWAPDAQTFAYVHGGALNVATAPANKPAPPAVQQALTVVKAFMDARLAGQTQHAQSFLDSNGQAAYAGTSSGPVLIPQGDPSFKRYYIVMSEANPADHSVRVVVRLVFAHNKVEQQAIDETLTLVREQATDPYLIDNATAGPVLQLGKGPQVVAVKVTATSLSVTFDSDLLSTSISSVTLQDGQGAVIQSTPTYSDRTVTFTGLQLTPGASYRLVVLPGIADFHNNNAAAEYDLDFIGPAAPPAAGGSGAAPSPSPSPAVTPSAVPSPSQSA